MDPTPTALFEAYEQDFRHLLESVKSKLDEIRDQRGEQRKAVLRRVEIELDEADDIISQLEIEIQGIPVSIRTAYSNRLKTAKQDLSRYKKQSKDVHGQSAHVSLATSDDPYSDRARLLVGTHTLADGSRRLEDSNRIALETEALGADILRDLRQQGETIRNAHETLHTADDSIGRATGTLKKMIWQNKKQRVIFSLIAAVGVVILLVILYFKIIH